MRTLISLAAGTAMLLMLPAAHGSYHTTPPPPPPPESGENTNPPNTDPPDYSADAGDDASTPTSIGPGSYTGASDGAVGGTEPDQVDAYRFSVPGGRNIAIDAAVKTPGAALHFIVRNPNGDTVGEQVADSGDDPTFSYRTSNAAGGDWGFEVQLVTPMDGTVVHYDLTLGIYRSGGGGGDYGGAMAATALLALLGFGLLRRR